MTDPNAMSLPSPFKLLWQQFRIEWRLYMRDRGAMFWTFLFPLLMLFGFGVIFRSGGQAQRLALALALVSDPDVVFLDEPTAGLDPQGRRSLWEIVRAMKAEGRTTILTTHYMDEAEALCDRLAILDHGKILRSGTPAELIASLGIPSVVELTFEGPAPDPSAFAAKLNASIEARGDVWEIPTPDLKTLLPRLFATIESQGLEYDQVHVRRATLEDVFLNLTGRSLRE